MRSDCQKVVSANAQPILPRLGEDEEGGPSNDERKLKKTAKPMHLTVDPLLALQLLVAVLMVLTMPDNNELRSPKNHQNLNAASRFNSLMETPMWNTPAWLLKPI